MREVGHVFKTKWVKHNGTLQATPGCSNREAIERGGDCDKQSAQSQPEEAAPGQLQQLVAVNEYRSRVAPSSD